MNTISLILCLIFTALALAGCMGTTNSTTGTTPTPELPTVDTTIPGTSGTDSAAILEKIWGLFPEEERFAVYGGAMSHAVSDGPGDLDLKNTEELTGKYLLPEAQIANVKDAASLMHMMNGNIFTAAVVTLDDGADGEALVKAWRETIHQNRWICGQPDEMLMYRMGDHILMAFGSNDAMTVFEAKTAEAFPDGTMLYSEPIVG